MVIQNQKKLNMIMRYSRTNLTFSRVVWNILRHPLMLPTILLLMIYKVSSPSSLFSWSTRFSLSQVGFSTGEVVTSLKLVEVGIGKVFVKNISGEPPKNNNAFNLCPWFGQSRISLDNVILSLDNVMTFLISSPILDNVAWFRLSTPDYGQFCTFSYIS